MRVRHVIALAVAAVAAVPSAAAAQSGEGERIVDLERPTPVSEHDGWVLFSRWDGEGYRLSTWHEGEVRDLPVPRRPRPFDADAGPDSSGRPSAALSLCIASCDLYVVGFEPGDRLRPVRNANTKGHDEVAPSVWDGRLVFGRRYGPDKVIAYTKRLRAPRSRPSDRVGRLRGKRCGAVDPPRCRRVEDVELVHMDLWHRWIGQSWTYQADDFGGFRQNEILLASTRRKGRRLVAEMTTGLGGQTYVGLSLAEGHVAFFKACQGDPGGCSRDTSGAIRYRISTRHYSLAGANESWTGWAWSGDVAYRVSGADACGGEGDPGFPSEPCGVYRQNDLDWEDAPAERFR